MARANMNGTKAIKTETPEALEPVRTVVRDDEHLPRHERIARDRQIREHLHSMRRTLSDCIDGFDLQGVIDGISKIRTETAEVLNVIGATERI